MKLWVGPKKKTSRQVIGKNITKKKSEAKREERSIKKKTPKETPTKKRTKKGSFRELGGGKQPNKKPTHAGTPPGPPM